MGQQAPLGCPGQSAGQVAAARYWGLQAQAPWTTIAQDLALLQAHQFTITTTCDAVAQIVSLALLVAGARLLPLPWTLYAAASWVFVLTHFSSTARYVLVIFPLYVAAAHLLRGRSYLAAGALSAGLLVFLSYEFVAGWFVA